MDTLENEENKIDTKKHAILELLKREIQSLENHFSGKYKEKIRQTKVSLSVSISECAGLIDSLNTMNNFASTVLKHGTRSQMAILCQELRNRESNTLSCLQCQEELPPVSSCQFIVDEIKNLICKLSSISENEVLFQGNFSGKKISENSQYD